LFNDCAKLKRACFTFHKYVEDGRFRKPRNPKPSWEIYDIIYEVEK